MGTYFSLVGLFLMVSAGPAFSETAAGSHEDPSSLVSNAQVRSSSELENAENRIESLATAEQKCTLQYLKDLGWTIRVGKGSDLTVNGGNPCDNKNAKDSKREGELEILLPSTASSAEIKNLIAKLPSLVVSEASKCAYKFKVGVSTRRAAERLTKATRKGTFRFSKSGDDLIGKYNATHWVSGDTCIQARSTPSKAIECIYSDECRFECFVGRQILSLAALYELYGPTTLDKHFKNSEFAIGSWTRIQDNPIEKTSSKEAEELADSVPQYVELGQQALVGLRGYIGNSRGESFLDTTEDRGENFVVVEATQKAIEEMSRMGSFSKTKKLNALVWSGLSKSTKEVVSYLKEEGLGLPWTREKAIQEIEGNPIYTDIKVYVHLLGIMNYGDHLKRLSVKNPRTPYTIGFYEDRLMGSLYDRFHQIQMDNCLRK